MGRLHHSVKVALVLLMLCCAHGARAQYDAAFNHYWTLQSLYNPAASGLDGMLNVQGVYAMQMMGYEHAPATMAITADLPLWMVGPAHGVGAGFVNDKIGLFSHKRFFLQYAYHHKLWGGRLSGGVRGAMLAESFDGTGLDVLEDNDDAFPTSEANGTAFDLDAGLRYDGRQWYVGVSASHILSPRIELGESKVNEFNVSSVFYLTGGYNINLRTPLLKVQTAAIVRSDLGSAWRADVTGRLIYNGPNGRMYAGLAYSPNISASLLIGGDFHGIQLGYSYEAYTSGVGALQGSHELSIGYVTDLSLFKKGKNRHQSVRIL